MFDGTHLEAYERYLPVDINQMAARVLQWVDKGVGPLDPGNLRTYQHSFLETRVQKTAEPGSRSCLTGFTLLMRHARLWELAAKGQIKFDEPPFLLLFDLGLIIFGS